MGARGRFAWLADAPQALAELDDEIVEDGLPEIGPAVRKQAERIIGSLQRHPWAPTVHPTRDAEVAIHFESPDPQFRGRPPGQSRPGRVLRLHWRAQRRSRYDASSDLPDDFVKEQLAARMPPRVRWTCDARPERIPGNQ